MSRLFDDASTEYLQIAQAVLAGVPLAMACLFRSDANVHQTLMGISDKDVNDHYHVIHAYDDGSKIWAYSHAGFGNEGIAQTSSGWTLNTLHHACALFVTSTDHRIFIDGGSKGTNNTGAAPANLDTTFIGRRTKSTPQYYMSGMIAEAAIWNLSVWPGASDSDKADNFERILPSLAKGFTPDNYPLGLVAYWPLIRGVNDKFGGYNLTAYGSVVVAHPNVIQPCGVA